MDVSPVSLHQIEAIQPQHSSPFRPDVYESTRRVAREETRQVAAAVQQLNAAGYSGPTRELTILFDQKTGRPMVRIVDKETGEVLRQIPPEYVLRMAQEAKERLKEGAVKQADAVALNHTDVAEADREP